MKYILIVVAILFGLQTSAISQRGEHGGDKGKINHLKTELELSDAQADELKSIFEAMRENKEETSREEKKAAMEEAIVEVLTDEQLAKYEELQLNRKVSRGKNSKAGMKGRKMRKGLSKDEETLNRLKEMRVELDESISADDKIEIDHLRQSFANRKEVIKENREVYKELSDDEKKEFREERKTKRDEMKADIKQLKELTKKYNAEISSLLEENKDFFEEKKAERKEEWKEKKEERKEEGKEGRKANRENRENKFERKHSKEDHTRTRGGHFSKGMKFLLMDSNSSTDDASGIVREFNSISVSPNPASVMTNVTYEVKNDGQVRVEIRDESGRVYEVVTNESMKAGTYTKAIETSKYQDKTYYISISDGKSIKTEKLLIQK